MIKIDHILMMKIFVVEYIAVFILSVFNKDLGNSVYWLGAIILTTGILIMNMK